MRKLATVAFAFSAAIFAANYVLPECILLPTGLMLAVLCLTVWFVFPAHGRKRLRTTLILSGLSAGVLWMCAFLVLDFEPVRVLDDRTVRLEFTVSEYPQKTDFGYSVVARCQIGSLRGTDILLYTDEQGSQLYPGDQVCAVTHCSLADHTKNGERITYYTAKGIYLLGETYGRLEQNRPNIPPVSVWPTLVSHRISTRIEQIFPPDMAPLMQALVAGNRENLSDTFTTSLQRTGLSHTVVVSGMHLSVLAGMLSLCLGTGRRRTAILTGICVILFCGVVGNTPSVIRAAVMILFLQAAPLFKREVDSITSLGVALMFLLAWNPFSASHIGLQLSFASVAGIQVASQKIQDHIIAATDMDRPIKQRWVRRCMAFPRMCIAAISTTLGAMLFTVPLTAIHFELFSVIAPVSNLLTLGVISILFMGGVICGLFPVIGGVLVPLLTWFAHYVYWIVDVLGRFSMASIPLDHFYYRIWLLFVYLIVALGFIIKGHKRIVLPGCMCVVTFCISFLMTVQSSSSDAMTAVILDVGQGQSVLLQSGQFLALIDCGGNGYENAGDIAANYIQALGRNTLDLLVISHYHADHANGIPQLLRRVKVEEIALPDVEPQSFLRTEILKTAQEQQASIRFIREDTSYQLKEQLTLDLIPPLGTGSDLNELGLTALATAEDFNALLTGDMSGNAELLLLEHRDFPDIELLIAGHHGSNTSTTPELLQALRPEIAVISVGKQNRYGHPGQETLKRLNDAEIKIYRTDIQGMITVRANQRSGHN